MKKFFSGKRLLIILAAATIIGVVVAVHSCSNRVEPDLTISYIGEGYFSSDEFYAAVPMLGDVIEDINGDRKKEIELVTINFNSNLTASQQQSNMAKMTMSMGQGKSRLYFMDRQYCEYYADEEILVDLTELVPEGAQTLVNSKGEVYGISIEGNPVMRELGLYDTENVYVAMRAITEIDYVNYKNPGPEEMNKAAEDVLLYIVNYNNKEM